MKIKKLSAILFASTILSVGLAQAQDQQDSAWYLLPGLSYTKTDSDLKADDGMGGFLKLGKQINPQWDIQLGASYGRFDEQAPQVSGGQYKQTLLGFDALYMLSREQFRPFLLVGLGLARNDVDYSNQWGSAKNSALVNAGIGAQYDFNDRFGLQADIRQVWSRAEVGPAQDRDNQIIGNTLINLGLIIRLDAPSKPMPMAPEPAQSAPVVVPEPVAEPAPKVMQPAAPECQPKLEKMTIQAETLFDFDRYQLKSEGMAILDQLIPTLKNHEEIEMILVTGHTDRIGSEQYNMKLSKQRAEVVSRYLVSKGVDSHHIRAEAKGESEPIIECKGIRGKKLIECLAPNRRVDIDATHIQREDCQ